MRWMFTLVALVIVTGMRAQQLPAFEHLRYEEDYAVLKNDSITSFYRKLKYAALSKNRDAYLSVGGQARVQYIYYKHDQWSDAPEATHGEVLNRFLLHGDLHMGKHARVFAQLQSSLAVNMEEAGPVDHNSLELHQAFIEFKTSLNDEYEVVARTGRQELSYGSERLISVREGPNNRQSFDAAKLILSKKDFSTDIFYSYHVQSKKGIFNDKLSGNTQFWGMYAVKNRVPVIRNIDLYYLGLLKRQAVFDDGTGREMRHSIGTRLWDHARDWKYDFEAVYQFGEFAQKQVRAWTASINTSYTFSKLKFSPAIGVKTELITGNRNYDDNSLQTFNPLFPRGAYFGLAGLLGPENLVGIHSSASLIPLTGLFVAFNYDKIRRQSVRDGIYSPGGFLIYTGRNTTEKLIGNQYSFILDYNLNRLFSVAAVFTWFDAGDYLREISAGKDVLFTGISAEVKF